MEITNIHVDLDPSPRSNVLAYCKATIDNCFVIHDLKLIMGKNGVFVDMPDREVKQPCWNCNENVECSCQFCTNCGAPKPHQLNEDPAKRFHDVAHPITTECRQAFEAAIIEAYENKLNNQ